MKCGRVDKVAELEATSPSQVMEKSFSQRHKNLSIRRRYAGKAAAGSTHILSLLMVWLNDDRSLDVVETRELPRQVLVASRFDGTLFSRANATPR